MKEGRKIGEGGTGLNREREGRKTREEKIEPDEEKYVRTEEDETLTAKASRWSGLEAEDISDHLPLVVLYRDEEGLVEGVLAVLQGHEASGANLDGALLTHGLGWEGGRGKVRVVYIA